MTRRSGRGADRRRLSKPRLPGELGEPVAVGDAAAIVGAELGLAEPRVFTRLVESWVDVVGEAVAQHSRIRSVRDGVLEIAVDSPAWATPLRYLERDIIERASLLLGEGVVRQVRVGVDAPGRDGVDAPGRDVDAPGRDDPPPR